VVLSVPAMSKGWCASHQVPCGIAADDYRALLHELARLEPPFTIFGGVAEDLLLHGKLTHAHNDVDVPRLAGRIAGANQELRAPRIRTHRSSL
jgi:hypothetical protein